MKNGEPTVPGEFCCPQCGFVVIKSIINPTTGQTGRDAADRIEQCPNDGTILRPVSYADALSDARRDACNAMAMLRIAEQMKVLLHNLVMRHSIHGHERKAAENILGDWKARLANQEARP